MLDAGAVPDRIAQLAERYPEANAPLVADIVRAVLGSMQGDLTAQEASLLSEVEELAQTVASARAEIAKLRTDDITDAHIPSATDELDAIVAHTAAATNQILEACETLDTIGGALAGEAAQSMQDATTKIYEACSFQDITGQRITKVVSTLKTIETKVAHITDVFRRDDFTSAAVIEPPPPAPEPVGDEGLLHGPQLPANAMDQSDIDALLASFD